MSVSNDSYSSWVSLFSGAAAGTAVDISLFPLDTLKTRLQAPQGFVAAGGFRGVYSGLGAAVIGSAPNAALFFVTYDTCKHLLTLTAPPHLHPLAHSCSAAFGEIVACLIRVPVEIVKQRAQASTDTPREILKAIFHREGYRGLYRGYTSTVLREIPFSFIQFPIWEGLKARVALHKRRPVQPHESALCGAVAGGISAGLTTPLDVAKTRIMLAKSGSVEARGYISETIKIVYKEKGFPGLFAGLAPRVTWISIGGCVFFGVYEYVADVLRTSYFQNPQ